MSNLIESIENKIKKIAEKHKIFLIYLFGSQAELGEKYLKGEKINPEPYSDLDIAVLFETAPQSSILTYGELYKDFSLLFDPFEIDLVFIDEVDSLFQYEIIKGIRIYERDPDFADYFEEIVMKKASDLSFKQREFVKDVLEAIRDGYFEFEYKADS